MLEALFGPIVGLDAPAPLDISTTIDQLRLARRDALADALLQIQNAIYALVGTLQLEIPLDRVDALKLIQADSNMESFVNIQPISVAVQDGSSSGTLVKNGLAFLTSPASALLVVAATAIQLAYAIGTIDLSLKVDTTAGAELAGDDETGTQAFKLNKTGLYLGGNQVVLTRQASVSKITDTAGTTYTAAEQTMLANLKAAINSLNDRLNQNGHGLISGT